MLKTANSNNDLFIETGANGLGLQVTEKKVWNLVNSKIQIFFQLIQGEDELNIKDLTAKLVSVINKHSDFRDDYHSSPFDAVESFLKEYYPRLSSDFINDMYVEADGNYLAFDVKTKSFIETKDLEFTCLDSEISKRIYQILPYTVEV